MPIAKTAQYPLVYKAVLSIFMTYNYSLFHDNIPVCHVKYQKSHPL